MELVRIVGIDCAVQPENVAVAAGDWTPAGLQIRDAMHCKRRVVSDVVCSFVDGAGRAILALDAPLGWPTALGETLARHCVGATLEATGHRLFRRETDEVVKRVTGKQPLDVGADRIARTAAAALTLLGQVRERLGRAIPLAWSPDAIIETSAIEVYPAATLRILGIAAQSYKEPQQTAARATIAASLARFADLSKVQPSIEANADALDAVVCVLAAADFINGRCLPPSPEQRETAQREGWIWFRHG